MELKGKRIGILSEDMYEDLELWYPLLRFKEAAAQVTLIGREKGKAHAGKHGYAAVPDMAAAEAKADDFDCVIIPGGYAPDMMRRNAAMVKLVKDACDRGKVVAAICHAGWMLCSAGVLRGKKVTSYFSIKDDMVNAGGIWVDQAVVRDGNIITSRMPDDLPHFCKEIIAALSNARVGGAQPALSYGGAGR